MKFHLYPYVHINKQVIMFSYLKLDIFVFTRARIFMATYFIHAIIYNHQYLTIFCSI